MEDRMELRWTTQWRDLDGVMVVRLEGMAGAQAAQALAQDLSRLAHEQDLERLELNVARCSGDLDSLVLRLLGELRNHELRVALTGLTQHQLRLLGYLGFADMSSPHG
jgi:hypothetical protein